MSCPLDPLARHRVVNDAALMSNRLVMGSCPLEPVARHRVVDDAAQLSNRLVMGSSPLKSSSPGERLQAQTLAPLAEAIADESKAIVVLQSRHYGSWSRREGGKLTDQDWSNIQGKLCGKLTTNG